MVHPHSRSTYSEIQQNGLLRSRKASIIQVLKDARNRPHADYQIQAILFPESDDLRKTSPRVSDLKNDGILIEGPPIINPAGRIVRTVKLKEYSNQISMF